MATTMSHQRPETQKRSASQSADEIQPVAVSQGFGETQSVSANPPPDEPQTNTAKEDAKPPRPRKHPYLHVCQRLLYDAQKVRIGTFNRIDSLFNLCAVCKKRISGSDSQMLIPGIDSKTRCECDSPTRTITKEQYGRVHDKVVEVTVNMEKTADKLIAEALGKTQIYEWLSRMKGCGPRLGASFIALIDPIRLFPTISSLWAYAGSDVVEQPCPVCSQRPAENQGSGTSQPTSETQACFACPACNDTSVVGVGVNKNTPNGRAWNWELKMAVCEKFPTQVIKLGQTCAACERPISKDPKPDKHCQCDNPQPRGNGYYRRYYDKVKAEYQKKHPEPKDTGKRTKAGNVWMSYTPMHIERMARRKVGKLFLAHLWLKWRKSEGLPISEPWITALGGHAKFIEPPEVDE
jgi:hypothetical protein